MKTQTKKGSKILGILFKLFGKKLTKEAVTGQIVDALDTNKDREVTWEDFANGAWKKINWLKLVFALFMAALALVGMLVYGLDINF